MSELGERFFSSLVKTKDMDAYVRLGKFGHLFTHTESDKLIYEKLQNHIVKYGKLPSKQTYLEIVGRKTRKTSEPPKYYLDDLTKRHIRHTLIKAGESANEKLKNKDEHGALEVLKSYVAELGVQEMGANLYDFRESHDILAHELKKKKDVGYGVSLGWPTFDDMSGSLRGGDLLSFVGRPAAGKTFLSLQSALTIWRKNKKTVLFITMEMKPVLIFERLAAMYQGIPYNWVKLGAFPTLRKDMKKQFLRKMAKIQELDLPPFYIVDGDLTATTQDISELVQQLKPDVLIVDGAYLVEIPKRYNSDQEKVGGVCTHLKKNIASAFDIPVIGSWQLNRDSTKIKKTEKAGIEHISYSDKIGQLSSLVLGLFQEDSVETLRQRDIRIMKGRGGETGQFQINWNFLQMDFSEVEHVNEFEVQIS